MAQTPAFHLDSGFVGLSGTVYGGRHPIAGASIQLYAAGSGGDGSAAAPLVVAPVTTDSNGSFNLTGLYECLSPASEVYLVATGGNPGLENGATNAQIALMTPLGPCGDLAAPTSVEINEVTTIATTYALAPYMQSYSAIGSGANDAQMMADAFTMATELADAGTGVSPGVGIPTGQTVPSQKLNTLANIVSTCINSSGGTAGDSSPCGRLLALAPATGGVAPTDTVAAVLDIAQDPTGNVAPIFNLDPPASPFAPSLPSAPVDWSLTMSSPTASPALSPSPGAYAASPSIALSDSNPSATIYYTVDGSTPTSSSIPYTGAFVLSGTTTIRAVAIAGGISSLLAAGTYALQAPAIALTPGSVTLASSQTQAFSAIVSGESNTAVNWSLSPAIGNISPAGLYTPPTSIPSAQTVTVTATSTADPLLSAESTVSLAPQGGGALSPLVPPVGAFLKFLVSPANLTVGNVMAPAPQVAMEYANGSVMTGFSGQVTIAFANSPANATLSGTLTVTAVNGIATFSDLGVSLPGPGYQLGAASPDVFSGALSATFSASAAETVTPATVTLTPSHTQAFTATFSNGSNPSVTWSLSSGAGSISSSGVYTAPATVPYPNTVTVTATSVANPTVSASATVTISALVGTTYYLAPASGGGSDYNNGLSASAPWLSVNHAVNCGDVILAAAGSYAYSSFYYNWGTVTCAAGNDVAWLKCATFDACKISTSSNSGMIINSSYWGVQGWEVSAPQGGACFFVRALTSVAVHHIIFANNVANGCQGGFGSVNNGSAPIDYIAMVGNIAYNASLGSGTCNSNISIYSPVAYDTLPGTHLYVAGNITYDGLDPNPCDGTAPTDGEGIILDDFKGNQQGNPAYTQQAVVNNNLVFLNGGRGIEIFDNSSAPIVVESNTAYGNSGDPNQNSGGSGFGDLEYALSSQTTGYLNLLVTNTASSGVGPNTHYGVLVNTGGSTDQMYSTWAYSASGTSSGIYYSAGFTYGANNTFGTNPNLANPVNPGAPSCSSATNAPNCMAAVIANFTPTTAAAVGFGYQVPSASPSYDPLFPQWLCNVNLPAGLVTMGCELAP